MQVTPHKMTRAGHDLGITLNYSLVWSLSLSFSPSWVLFVQAKKRRGKTKILETFFLLMSTKVLDTYLI